MPLFAISNQRLSAMEQSNFAAEKTLQGLIEKNLAAKDTMARVIGDSPSKL